ncbi:MAG: hypothetical protein HC890_04285 [Chloroflexaceae bacterium]|nr:hypothetical protein [Chloroflexaceae bacterium]
MNNPDKPQFKPRQIVCLDDLTACLYCEVIQIIEVQQVCWARPLLLASKDSQHPDPSPRDLRLSADLLCPVTWFRPALDTEAVPLLLELETSVQLDATTARAELNAFVRSAWQERPKI